MTGRLVTFGYAGLRGPTELRDLLAAEDVDTIIDVRLHAYSWNRAFSRTTRQTVEAAGFRYVHLPDLGNLAHRAGGTEIRNINAIKAVVDQLRAGRTVALMCRCPDWRECHRELLADEVLTRLPGVEVRHRA